MGWFSWFFIKIRCVNRNPVRNTVMMTTRWPREWWILLWFCSFPLEFSKERNDQKSHAKSWFRLKIRLVVFSYTFQLALDQKPGSNSQIWDLDFPNNFFLRSGSLTPGDRVLKDCCQGIARLEKKMAIFVQRFSKISNFFVFQYFLIKF